MDRLAAKRGMARELPPIGLRKLTAAAPGWLLPRMRRAPPDDTAHLPGQPWQADRRGMMQPDSGNPVRLLGLLAALALAFGCLLVLRPFLSALLWAAILVYSTWPAFRMLRERLRAVARPRRAA